MNLMVRGKMIVIRLWLCDLIMAIMVSQIRLLTWYSHADRGVTEVQRVNSCDTLDWNGSLTDNKYALRVDVVSGLVIWWDIKTWFVKIEILQLLCCQCSYAFISRFVFWALHKYTSMFFALKSQNLKISVITFILLDKTDIPILLLDLWSQHLEGNSGGFDSGTLCKKYWAKQQLEAEKSRKVTNLKFYYLLLFYGKYMGNIATFGFDAIPCCSMYCRG